MASRIPPDVGKGKGAATTAVPRGETVPRRTRHPPGDGSSGKHREAPSTRGWHLPQGWPFLVESGEIRDPVGVLDRGARHFGGSTTISTQDYTALLNDVRERIRGAQLQALRAVNRELIGLYWDVGRMIVDRQEAEGWGRSVVERLARDLQVDLKNVHGFSASNLWRMRGFYRAYMDSPNLAPRVREIGWSHNLVILERCKDDQQREFYLRMTRRMGWISGRPWAGASRASRDPQRALEEPRGGA